MGVDLTSLEQRYLRGEICGDTVSRGRGAFMCVRPPKHSGNHQTWDGESLLASWGEPEEPKNSPGKPVEVLSAFRTREDERRDRVHFAAALIAAGIYAKGSTAGYDEDKIAHRAHLLVGAVDRRFSR